jgi:hypothetical protein
VAKLCAKLFGLLVVVSLIQLTLIRPNRSVSKDVQRLTSSLSANPDIVYFGDSSNASVAEADVDRRPIAACLADSFGASRVCSLDGPAYHAEVYEACIDLLLRRGLHPQAVIIPINLRSLSPEWHLRPEYQFTKLKRELDYADHLLYRAASPLIDFLRIYDDEPISRTAFEKSPVYCGTEVMGCVREFENPSYEHVTPEATRNKFIFHYMYELQPEHDKLAAFVRIAQKLRDARITAVFYITPIDVETGERFLPGQFREQVTANIGVIQNELAPHQTPVIDLAFALPPRDFVWQRYPNEHLCSTGRTFVADKLAEVLQPLAEDPSRVGPRELLASPISDRRQR